MNKINKTQINKNKFKEVMESDLAVCLSDGYDSYDVTWRNYPNVKPVTIGSKADIERYIYFMVGTDDDVSDMNINW